MAIRMDLPLARPNCAPPTFERQTPKCDYERVTTAQQGERFEIHRINDANPWLRVWDLLRSTYVWSTTNDDLPAATRWTTRHNRAWATQAAAHGISANVNDYLR
ncbi:hypothetical protein RM572_00685 [Streptomyces sp. DSM 42041]|uniref:Transposase n=1 Tax=Streptomyces hazeniae TaxID=3075538 RepID=A0ABU2NJZ1_9ACTN|nr:hypothetical protein [Streptomyces sp. DSM 42041]MDT0377292.1 hypothetical protein [Streptomyces sp. DSM 42041]